MQCDTTDLQQIHLHEGSLHDHYGDSVIIIIIIIIIIQDVC